MFNVSNTTLMKIAAVGGFMTVTMGMLAQNQISRKIKQTDYYKEVLQTIRTNQGVVHLLGEPIKEKTIIVNDPQNVKENEVHFEVPVKGPKQKGTIYFWATKQNNSWTVNRIELGLANEPNRRLLVKHIDNVEK